VKKQVLKLNELRSKAEVKNGGIFGVYVFQEISPARSRNSGSRDTFLLGLVPRIRKAVGCGSFVRSMWVYEVRG
jgi:hypothetical protein